MLQDQYNGSISSDLKECILTELPCGLCALRQDESLSLLFANQIFYRMLGKPAEDVALVRETKGLSDYADGEAMQAIVSQINRMKQNQEQATAFETRLRRPDGSPLWTMIRICQAEFEGGIWICALMDISTQKLVEEELRVREEEYRIAVRQSDKFVFRYDIEKGTVYLPPESAQLFHVETLQDLPDGLEAMGEVHPDSQDAYHEIRRQIRSGEHQTGSAVLQIRLGNERRYDWYRVVYSLIYREDGSPAQAVISLQNVSEQHMREVAYRRWEQTYGAMPQKNTAYLEFDLTQNHMETQKGELIEPIPEAWSDTMEHAVAYVLDNYVHTEDRERIRLFVTREHLLTEYFRGAKLTKPEYRHLRSDGRYGWVRLSAQMLPDPYSSNIRVSLLLRDIDAQKREELLLKDQLRTDMLTGVLNRGALVEATEALFGDDRGGQHALVMVDVDHFKQINDHFGHSFGDRVLVRVCAALRGALRTDDLVGRIGGDEFVVLLKNVSNRSALQTKINQLCEQLCQRISNETVVSCSFGAAFFPADGESFDELYRKADIAMYAAKEAGRNCARIYDQQMGCPMTLFDGSELG